jgi:hypothetical protein
MLPPLTRFFVSPTIATQNLVPGTHDTGDIPGPWLMPSVYLAGSFTAVQSLPDRAA